MRTTITMISLLAALAGAGCTASSRECDGIEPADLADATVVRDGGGECPDLVPGTLLNCWDAATPGRDAGPVCRVGGWSCQGVDLADGRHLGRLDLAGPVYALDGEHLMLATGTGYYPDGTPCAAAYEITIAR